MSVKAKNFKGVNPLLFLSTRSWTNFFHFHAEGNYGSGQPYLRFDSVGTCHWQTEGRWVLGINQRDWRNIPCVFSALCLYAHTNRYAGTEGHVLNGISLFLILPPWSTSKSSSASVLSCINISADALQVNQGCVAGECSHLQSPSCSSCSSWKVPWE